MSKATLVLAAVAVAALTSAAPVSASASTHVAGTSHRPAASTTGAKVKKGVVRAAAPPACVSATYRNPAGPYQDVYVRNDCPTTQRVKVVWAYATDSACHLVAPGETWKDHHLNQNVVDRWDGIKTC